MDKKELILASLSCAKGKKFSPVQVQKLFFLLDRNISERIGGPHFDFEPYNYGPYDKEVYEEIEKLEEEGMVIISPYSQYVSYKLSSLGQKEGDKYIESLPEKTKNLIQNFTEFVLDLSFSELVRAIYKAYPDMRTKSVFTE